MERMNGILKRLALKIPPVRDYVARVHERRHDAEQQIKALAARATSLEQEVSEAHERRHDAEQQIKALAARGASLEQEVAEEHERRHHAEEQIKALAARGTLLEQEVAKLAYAIRERERDDAAIGLGPARKELATASSKITYAQNFEDVMIARAFE